MKLSLWPRSKTGLRYDHGWATDIGAVRTRNEDSVLPPAVVNVPQDGEVLLTAVADGVGGMDDGDRASSTAIQNLMEAYRPESEADIASALLRAVSECGAAVAHLNEGRPENGAMASTIVALAVHVGRACVVHVGDSRAYLLRGGRLKQLTRDHSMVTDAMAAGEMNEEEARASSMRNLLTRALGSANAVPELSREVALRRGDRLLLCSDGVYSVVPHTLLAAALGRPEKAQRLADLCVRHALDRGAPDNATAVVIRIERPGEER